ncbi:hypothetical protein EX30DRAFT_231036 [Ascodesmis nigricans]|uniref:Uncharacterized protein n=1 Tax=Ascodesmis nigricans TaxID=341454 RepID=A0A4S2MIH0_9PEZI|nr:hypothetical protein EX30DRAFT_231036 [Ascodesmis nigricans]
MVGGKMYCKTSVRVGLWGAGRGGWDCVLGDLELETGISDARRLFRLELLHQRDAMRVTGGWTVDRRRSSFSGLRPAAAGLNDVRGVMGVSWRCGWVGCWYWSYGTRRVHVMQNTGRNSV